ncbi:MAG TPA: protein kinase [Chitinophagaceae bacterium]|nr:protein kinase [Chitinophagaceae bacterium]
MAKVFTITEGLENMGAIKTGGQGSIYKGRRMGEIITAVKLLPTPIHSENPNDKHYTDFQNEVQKLKKVNEESNPNVVKILGSGITETGNLPFIEMEFIEGPDLEELLKPPHDKVFTLKETMKLAEHLSNALAHCHRVGVKHGDIKSNNVKFNKSTGNYMLLDFGLAIMSDEERRTSLRRAGAIEFMAPEQNEGVMLFETDVYSFGVILFELLAGTVPFPLKDKGETARNMVMVSHMETPVPDFISLRKMNLPPTWSNEKKEQEMQVPGWMLTTIYKCLEKKPGARFRNGMELNEYLQKNNAVGNHQYAREDERVSVLQEKNAKLEKEKERLEKLLLQYTGKNEINFSSAEDLPATQLKKKSIGKRIFIPLLLIMILGSIVYFVIQKNNSAKKTDNIPATKTEKPRQIIGQYKVMRSRAYFHNNPDIATRRTAYMVPSQDVVEALDEENDFIYTEFRNNRGQVSKGWLAKQDLITLEEWAKKPGSSPIARLTPEDISIQLADAKKLLENNQLKEALYIYNYLASQEVPEAMFQYGHLGLKNKNTDINCEESISLLKKASDKDYTPAKRTLGFLYLFAENKEILKINNYDHCEYERNFLKGSKLLMEAVLSGDSTAKKLLDEVNLKRNAINEVIK